MPREEFERDADGLITPYTRKGIHGEVEEERKRKQWVNLYCCRVTHVYTVISVRSEWPI